MKATFLTLIFSAISFALFAQDFEVPKNYKLDKVEDYAPFESDVVKTIDWLMNTPVNEQLELRAEASAFLLKWIIGSPNVKIELKHEIATFMESSPDLLLIFMCGWTKYAIVSKDYDNKIEGNAAGIESVIVFYIKNRSVLSKDKNVEKYIKMKEKGTLKEYLQKNA